MANWFNFITTTAVTDSRSFDEKVIAAQEDDFVYMNKASEYPDADYSQIKGIKNNDELLQTPSAQINNAKEEFVAGLGYTANALGNTLLAGGHALAVAASLHNSFAVVTHLGSFVNEAKVVLGAAKGTEELIEKSRSFYDRVMGNSVKAHEPSKLDKTYNFVKGVDDTFHENTGYLTAGLNAIKTYFYPENVVGFFARSGKGIASAYQAVKCEVNAASAIAKAGYYAMKDLVRYTFDEQSINDHSDLSDSDFSQLSGESVADEVIA